MPEPPTVVVAPMDRFARNLRDLRTLVDDLTECGIVVKFLKENLVFTGEANSTGQAHAQHHGRGFRVERELMSVRAAEVGTSAIITKLSTQAKNEQALLSFQSVCPALVAASGESDQ